MTSASPCAFADAVYVSPHLRQYWNHDFDEIVSDSPDRFEPASPSDSSEVCPNLASFANETRAESLRQIIDGTAAATVFEHSTMTLEAADSLHYALWLTCDDDGHSRGEDHCQHVPEAVTVPNARFAHPWVIDCETSPSITIRHYDIEQGPMFLYDLIRSLNGAHVFHPTGSRRDVSIMHAIAMSIYTTIDVEVDPDVFNTLIKSEEYHDLVSRLEAPDEMAGVPASWDHLNHHHPAQAALCLNLLGRSIGRQLRLGICGDEDGESKAYTIQVWEAGTGSGNTTTIWIHATGGPHESTRVVYAGLANPARLTRRMLNMHTPNAFHHPMELLEPPHRNRFAGVPMYAELLRMMHIWPCSSTDVFYTPSELMAALGEGERTMVDKRMNHALDLYFGSAVHSRFLKLWKANNRKHGDWHPAPVLEELLGLPAK